MVGVRASSWMSSSFSFSYSFSCSFSSSLYPALPELNPLSSSVGIFLFLFRFLRRDPTPPAPRSHPVLAIIRGGNAINLPLPIRRFSGRKEARTVSQADRFRRKDLPSSEHRSPNKGIGDYLRGALNWDRFAEGWSLLLPQRIQISEYFVAPDSASRAGFQNRDAELETPWELRHRGFFCRSRWIPILRKSPLSEISLLWYALTFVISNRWRLWSSRGFCLAGVVVRCDTQCIPVKGAAAPHVFSPKQPTHTQCPKVFAACIEREFTEKSDLSRYSWIFDLHWERQCTWKFIFGM